MKKLLLLLVGIILTSCATRPKITEYLAKGNKFLYSSNWYGETKLTDTITIQSYSRKNGMVIYKRKNTYYSQPQRCLMHRIIPIKQ